MIKPDSIKSSVSAVERVVAAVQQQIRTGALEPGERLTEAALSIRYDLSRPLVREAIRRLESDGVLTFKRHRGAEIRRLSRGEIVDLMLVRESLEGLAASNAAERGLTTAEKAELRGILEALKEAGEAGSDTFGELYGLLHGRIVDLSRNKILQDLWGKLNIRLFERQLRPLISARLIRRAHREHEPLIAALEAGDAKKAERAMRNHIAHFVNHIQSLP